MVPSTQTLHFRATTLRKRTQYNLTHQVSTVGNIGNLVPFMIQEVAPGDTWSGKTGMLIRFAPLKRAALQDFYVDTFYFYVPHRMVWADWESFLIQGPMDDPDFSPPVANVPFGDNSYQSLFWMPHTTEGKGYNGLRLHAYNLVWNEFFRDPGEGIANPTDPPGQTGRRTYYKKDFWTTLQSWPGYAESDKYVDTTAGDGSQVSAMEILRAVAQQKIAMKRATYGTKYVDVLRSYGINVNYQMLQRPELVGVGRGVMNVTDVVATGYGQSPGESIGQLSGHGISGHRAVVKRKSFPEHGTLFGMLVVRPRFAEPRGVDWFDSPRTYKDYYDPGLVPMPSVEVKKKDAAVAINDAVEEQILGYKPWGDWYRSTGNKVHGDLDESWFGRPTLDEDGTFNLFTIKRCEASDYNDLFQDVTYSQFQVVALNQFRALRLLPRNNMSAFTGVPG